MEITIDHANGSVAVLPPTQNLGMWFNTHAWPQLGGRLTLITDDFLTFAAAGCNLTIRNVNSVQNTPVPA
jgi:hypothetical protein